MSYTCLVCGDIHRDDSLCPKGREKMICCHGQCQNLTPGIVFNDNTCKCKICGWVGAYDEEKPLITTKVINVCIKLETEAYNAGRKVTYVKEVIVEGQKVEERIEGSNNNVMWQIYTSSHDGGPELYVESLSI